MSCIDTVREWMISRGLCAPGSRVIAAVSGGPDSMALLEILARIARDEGFALAVAHFEHGIRPEAARERSIVERRASALDLPFMSGAGDIPAESRRLRMGLEETARLLRHRFLEECAASWKASAVALGHTRDDQIETILLNIIRGAGWRGLAGMPPRRGAFIRPLLGCGRDELRSLLRRARVRYAIDPSNRDTAMLRNRVRHVLLPLLRGRFNPAIDRSLLRLADNLAEVRDAVEEPIRSMIPRAGVRGEVRVALMRIERLDDFGLYLLVDLVLRERLGVVRDVEKKHYDAVKRLARAGRSGRRLSLPHGAEVIREQRHLLFRRAADAAPRPGASIRGTGRHLLPEWNLSVIVEPAGPGAALRATAREAVFSSLRFPLVVRPRRPGDRMTPFGMKGSKKLSDIMVDRKIPCSRRDEIPVFEDEHGPFWVPGVATDERTRVPAGRRTAVRIKLSVLRRGF
jgi:tRNA(Ile)-lysidine synthase